MNSFVRICLIQLFACGVASAGEPYIEGTYKPILFGNDESADGMAIRISEFPRYANAHCQSSLDNIVSPEMGDLPNRPGLADFNVASATSITLETNYCNELLPGRRLIVDASAKPCEPKIFDALLHCVRRTHLNIGNSSTWTLEVRTHPQSPELKAYEGVYPVGFGGRLTPYGNFSSPGEFRLRLLECSPDTDDSYIKGLFTHPAGGRFLPAFMINKVEILNPESSLYHPMYVLATTYVDEFRLVQAALFELHYRDWGNGPDRWHLVAARPSSAGGPITWSSTASGKDQRDREIKISCKDPERFTEPVYSVKFRD